MCLGCFVGASKPELQACVHCWESYITVPDCYYIRLPQIHSCALSQVPNSIFQSYLCCLERPRIWIHTHQIPSLYLQYLNFVCSSLCLMQTLCQHTPSTCEKKHLPEKPIFLSSTLTGINRLKNYFRKKTILAFKVW